MSHAIVDLPAEISHVNSDIGGLSPPPRTDTASAKPTVPNPDFLRSFSAGVYTSK
jgi:hypothetical protein